MARQRRDEQPGHQPGGRRRQLVEGHENYTVALATPGSTTGAPIALGTANSATTTITDNDTATWSITGDPSVTEGGNASYTVHLAGTLQAGETATIASGSHRRHHHQR